MNEIKIKLDGVEYSEKEARLVAGVLGEMTAKEVSKAIKRAKLLGPKYLVEVR